MTSEDLLQPGHVVKERWKVGPSNFNHNFYFFGHYARFTASESKGFTNYILNINLYIQNSKMDQRII